MNKKFMAMLLATVMVIGMLPMTAMADESHACGFDSLVYVDEKSHQYKCDTCNSLFGVPMNHNDGNGDRNCDGCGYEMYKAHECVMEKLVSISATQHQFMCTCNSLIGVPMNHNDGNGDRICDGCGYEMYKAHECVMEELVSISATQHQFKCTCNSLIGAAMNHNDADGDRFCDGCGYEMYEEHECVMEKLVSISATQHQFMCTCNSLIGVAMNHNDADGDRFCDGCKYEMYEAVEGDHEHKYVAHSNNNGTHNTSCTCGLGENNIACVDADKNGECDACKYYLMPVELPTYAAASTAGLDNVPKTGCAFIEWLYALIFG